MKTATVVQLQVYRGKDVSYDATGKPKTENFPVKIIHNTMEWRNFLTYMQPNGYCKVDVLAVNNVKGDDITPVADDLLQKVKAEVAAALTPAGNVKLTPEQARIAELERKIEALTANAGSGIGAEEVTPDLAQARKQYFTKFHKQGDKRWSAETLIQKIADNDSEN